MSNRLVFGQERLGKIWLPEKSKSMVGRPSIPQRSGVVVATQLRPRFMVEGIKIPTSLIGKAGWEMKNFLKDLLNPALLLDEMVWASITHNERVDDGASIQFNRTLGTIGASNGVANVVACATTGFTTKTATDSSIGTNAGDLTTNEHTANGLARAVGTVQNYVAPASLNATASGDVYKSFSSITGGGGTVHGSALFDSTTVVGSKLYVEDIFGTDATCAAGDTLNITWTVTM